MGKQELENLVKMGQLKPEPGTRAEFVGMLEFAKTRLADARNEGLSAESRFDLAYGTAPRARGSTAEGISLGKSLHRVSGARPYRRGFGSYSGAYFLKGSQRAQSSRIRGPHRGRSAASERTHPPRHRASEIGGRAPTTRQMIMHVLHTFPRITHHLERRTNFFFRIDTNGSKRIDESQPVRFVPCKQLCRASSNSTHQR